MTEKDFLDKCHDVLRKFEDKDTFGKCICEILHSGCIALKNALIIIFLFIG